MPVLLYNHLKSISVVHVRIEFFAIAAQILIDSAPPQHRARTTVVDRHLGRHHPHIGRPLDEDRVAGQQGVALVNHRQQLVQELFAFLQPARWQVRRRTAHGEVAVGQSSPACQLEEVQNLFPLAKRVQKRAETAQVQAVSPHPHQVAGNPPQLGNDHPQVLGLLWQLQVHQLFHAQRPAQVHVHPGQVVHAVCVGDPLPRREVFANFFRTAMQITDVRRHLRNDLTVCPEHQPQNTMRAGVLRAHVDQHLVRADVEFDQLGIHSLQHHRLISS